MPAIEHVVAFVTLQARVTDDDVVEVVAVNEPITVSAQAPGEPVHAQAPESVPDVLHAQSPTVAHPQTPPPPSVRPTHVVPEAFPAHDPHVPPVGPHAAGTSGRAQVDPLQQVPLQTWEDEHEVPHTWVAALHASPTGQFASVLHPHVPLTHAAPASPATQLAHMPPASPHIVAASPGSHVVPLQQTPLHSCVVEQVVVHSPVAVLHASPKGQ
jgi:hypothetical protein